MARYGRDGTDNHSFNLECLGDVHNQGCSGIVQASFNTLSKLQRMTVMLILFAYTFNAIGYLPHTLFWVDYLVRELGISMFSGGLYWAVFGIGAVIGPVLTGMLGDRVGIKHALIIAFIGKAIGVALPLLSTTPIALFISSLFVGILHRHSDFSINLYVRSGWV